MNKSNFSDLEVGSRIKLDTDDIFIIDKIFEGDYVDMTAEKEYNPELGLTFHEKFYSVRLINFEIIK